MEEKGTRRYVCTASPTSSPIDLVRVCCRQAAIARYSRRRGVSWCTSNNSLGYERPLTDYCRTGLHPIVRAIPMRIHEILIERFSEEAVEFNELDIFLRRNEDFKPFEDEKTLLRAEPIGVPGAYSPLQMYPSHAPSRSPSPSPLALREKEKKEINAGEELAEFGLANVSVTDDDLRALVAELGLGGDEADDLVKGLSSTETAPAKETKAALKPSETKPVAKPKEIKPAPKEEKPPVKEEEPLKVVVKAENEKEDQPKEVIIKEDEKEVQPKEVIAKDDDKKDEPEGVDVKSDDKKETQPEGDAKADDKKEAQSEEANTKEDDQKEEPKVVEDKKVDLPSVAAEASVPEETTKKD